MVKCKITVLRKMFNEDPPNYALATYVDIYMLKEAIEKAGTIETEAVVNALE